MLPPPPTSTLFPYTTLFRSNGGIVARVRNSSVKREELLGAHQDFLLVEQRSEEHTSELQSRRDLVCRLLLEKKKNHHHQTGAPERRKLQQNPRATQSCVRCC